MRLCVPILLLGCWGSGFAQDTPAFEVASVKPANISPGGYSAWSKGGPGTDDPTRIDYHNISMSGLICHAYGIEYYQIVGPEWITMERYEIAARLPAGTSQEQFHLMLQNLLAERFKLRVHRDRKELPRYSLTVAKNGPRFKPHVNTPPPADGTSSDRPKASGPMKTDGNGYPILDAGTTMAMMNGRARIRYEDANIAMLAGMIAGQLRAPVNDETGLTGKYDFLLSWGVQAAESENAPDLPTAVQEQLGLKLERKKGTVDVIVIDQVERTPTGN